MNFFSLPSPRRVLVIDPGSRSIKFLAVLAQANGMQILRHRAVDLPAGHLRAPEQANNLIQSSLKEFENLPVALSLPQHLSISQVIDLPNVGGELIKGLIREETAKFAGLSEGRIVYDYGKLNPFGKYRNPYWVTFAKEEEVLGEASRLAGVGERLCEIVTPANALVAAYQSLPSQPDHAVLVDLGASSTVVMLVVQRQEAYAIHYPMGSDAFSEAVASETKGSPEAAQIQICKEDLFLESSGNLKLRSAVDAWRFELEKILREWLRENPELNLSANSFRVFLSGGAVSQPGLLKYLRSTSHLRFTEWPNLPGAQNERLPDRYAVAYGVALKTLGVSLPSASLFPLDLREARKRRHSQELLQKATWILLLAVAFLLLFGTAQKYTLARKKNALLEQSRAILQEARGVEALHQQWAEAYEQLRPVLKQQQRSIDTLSTLSRLQQVRGEKNLWFVLFADQKSYFTGQTTPLPPPTLVLEPGGPTNSAPPGKYGFIAEVSLAEGGEGMRQTLSKVVTELKNNPAFTNIDTLPLDQRKSLVNTNVIIPERHFALSMELADDTFENALPPKSRRPEKRDDKTNLRALRPSTGGRSPFSTGGGNK